ncbi:MAG: hypothetical protein R3B39_00270 [Candidatus Paceibacterota bacterium]
MRLLKKLDIKNNKVMMGLLSLLFIGSLVQTSAILNVQQKIKNSDQSAQVTRRTCLEVEHKYNEDKMNYYSNEEGNPYRYSNFISYFSVKNKCTFDVRIISDAKDFTNFGGFKLFDAQYRNSAGEFVSRPDNSTILIDVVANENIVCLDCNDTYIYNYYADPFVVTTYLIPAGATKQFQVIANFTSNSQFVELQNLRMTLDHISYIRTSALTDGNITENEISDHLFSTEEKNLHAHDLVNFAPHTYLNPSGIIVKPEETKEEPKAKY